MQDARLEFKHWSAEEWAARAPPEGEQPESQSLGLDLASPLPKPGAGAATKAVTVKERLALCCATERQRLTFGKVGISHAHTPL